MQRPPSAGSDSGDSNDDSPEPTLEVPEGAPRLPYGSWAGAAAHPLLELEQPPLEPAGALIDRDFRPGSAGAVQPSGGREDWRRGSHAGTASHLTTQSLPQLLKAASLPQLRAEAAEQATEPRLTAHERSRELQKLGVAAIVHGDYQGAISRGR
jgi:hypothetical protein